MYDPVYPVKYLVKREKYRAVAQQTNKQTNRSAIDHQFYQYSLIVIDCQLQAYTLTPTFKKEGEKKNNLPKVFRRAKPFLKWIILFSHVIKGKSWKLWNHFAIEAFWYFLRHRGLGKQKSNIQIGYRT